MRRLTDTLGATRQAARHGLRLRADQALRGLLGRGLARADRRLVARAYANAAFRLTKGLNPLVLSRYTHYHGKPVVLNSPMTAWVAGVRTPSPEETAYAPHP